MKKKIFFTGLVAFFIMSCGQNDNAQKAAEDTLEKKADPEIADAKGDGMFGIKSAKIEFKYTGQMEGRDIFYFDDYGNTAVLVTDRKEPGGQNRQTLIWKDKKTTMINHEKKEASTSPFRPKDTEAPSISTTSEQNIKNIGYEKLPVENIAGRPCDVYFNARSNIKYWLWKKLDLKLINQGVYTKEAVSVEENITIPASLLTVPEGYKIK